jgi:Kef-type K+ transport system membrane component KefB
MELATGLFLSEDGSLQRELVSLLVIVTIAAFTPLLVGLLRLKIAEVVFLLVFGIIFGPNLLNLIKVDPSIELLSELGLGFLFFLAGLELSPKSIRGQSGRLAISGWGISLVLAMGAAFLLERTGEIQDFIGFAIVLTSTALGTLLPMLRDSGELKTPFGNFFMGAGAWGEFGPVLAIAILLSTRSSWAAIVLLIVFAIIAYVVSQIPGKLATSRIRELLERGHHSSSQTGVRLTILLIVLLLTVASGFGFDAVLGAFTAGIIMRQYLPEEAESELQRRVEAIAFGIFIPVFFIVSGANIDILAIIAKPWPMLAVFVLILLVRGVPQFFLYRKAIPDTRDRTRFMLFVATGLPIIVAVTSVEVAAGHMTTNDASELVAAGALTVLVFPFIATMMRRKRPAGSQGEDRSEATA